MRSDLASLWVPSRPNAYYGSPCSRAGRGLAPCSRSAMSYYQVVQPVDVGPAGRLWADEGRLTSGASRTPPCECERRAKELRGAVLSQAWRRVRFLRCASCVDDASSQPA